MEPTQRIQEIDQKIAELNREQGQLQSSAAHGGLMEKLNDYHVKKNELVEDVRNSFASLVTPLMIASGLINKISFTAYTPYFNDGDSCTYSVETNYLDVNDDEDVEGWGEKDDKIVEQMKEILGSIPDEIYLEVFGDHVKVTVHKDGTVETDEHDHD